MFHIISWLDAKVEEAVTRLHSHYRERRINRIKEQLKPLFRLNREPWAGNGNYAKPISGREFLGSAYRMPSSTRKALRDKIEGLFSLTKQLDKLDVPDDLPPRTGDPSKEPYSSPYDWIELPMEGNGRAKDEPKPQLRPMSVVPTPAPEKHRIKAAKGPVELGYVAQPKVKRVRRIDTPPVVSDPMVTLMKEVCDLRVEDDYNFKTDTMQNLQRIAEKFAKQGQGRPEKTDPTIIKDFPEGLKWTFVSGDTGESAPKE